MPALRLKTADATTALRLPFALALLALPSSLWAEANVASLSTSAGEMQIELIAEGFDTPWALGFLPDGSFLVTELGGRLLRVKDGQPIALAGLPQVAVAGQGGLLDVLVPKDFAQSREIYLSYALAVEGGSSTSMGRGRLSEDGTALEGFETLYRADPASGGRHFGSRLVEATDGTLYLTLGDRGTGPGGQEAQDPQQQIGKVMHLNRDGSPATTIDGWARGIWSIGHRNAQGATLDQAGQLLLVEHGAAGGDEVNQPQDGRNYGWPKISYGVDYSGAKIGQGQMAEGMEQPLHHWDPSIAPSGLMVYSGKLISQWAGDVFTGSLNSDFIARLDPQTKADTGWAEERLSAAQTGRVRDIREAPDGTIWFLSESEGSLFRLRPVAP